MRLDEITIEVRDANLVRVGQLAGADFSEILITPRSNNVGSWSVTMPDQVRNEDGTDTPHPMCQLLRQPGYGLIFTGPTGVILSGPTTGASHNASSNDPGGTWTITGVSDAIILGRSEAWPDPAHAPDAATKANDVRTAPAETLLHQFVSNNVGPAAMSSRRNAALVMGTNTAYGPTLTESPRYKNLLALCQEIVTGTALQFDVLQSGTALQFTTWIAADRTDDVRLDMDNNQLSSEQTEYSAPTATEVKVLGQGEGTARQVITRTSTAGNAAAALWHVRIERTLDQRQTKDVNELAQAGDDMLSEEGTTIFSFRVVPSGDLADTFEDGDFITIVVNNVETTAQVTERPISITSEGIFVGATIGDPTGFSWESLVDRRQDSAEQRISAIERNVEVSDLTAITGGASIPLGADLDSYLETGQYHQGTSVNADIALHYPLEDVGGLLIVETGTTFVSQRYVARPVSSLARTFARAKFSTNAWSTWVEVVFALNGPVGRIPTSVTVGGGTASVAVDGLVTFANAPTLSLNGVFDGIGQDVYQIIASINSTATLTLGTRMRQAGVDSTAASYQYTGYYTILNVGPTRYSSTVATSAGYFNPSTLAQIDAQAVMYLWQPAKAGTAARGIIDSYVIGGGDRTTVHEGFNTPGGTFDGITFLPSAGTISGQVKVVKLA